MAKILSLIFALLLKKQSSTPTIFVASRLWRGLRHGLPRPSNFDLHPSRHSSARGARLLLRRRLLQPLPLPTQLGSRGSPSTSATTAPAFALADSSARGARLLVRLQLLRPSPSLTQLGSRGSHSTSATTATAFALADTARLEGLALHFGDDYYGLRPRRHSSARGARLRLRRRLLRPSPSPTQLGSRGLTFYFGDDYYALRPCRHNSARGPRPPLRR